MGCVLWSEPEAWFADPSERGERSVGVRAREVVLATLLPATGWVRWSLSQSPGLRTRGAVVGNAR